MENVPNPYQSPMGPPQRRKTRRPPWQRYLLIAVIGFLVAVGVAVGDWCFGAFLGVGVLLFGMILLLDIFLE